MRIELVAKAQNEAGRLNVIIRMGADKIGARLPQILRELKREGRAILYSIDPMHGNTVKAANGYKTREFSKILSEVQSFFLRSTLQRARTRAASTLR